MHINIDCVYVDALNFVTSWYIYAICRLIKQRGQTSDKMLKIEIACAEICTVYANFCIYAM